uniref:G-type lectin S-receptor-like serine/threonine-protein kinase At1g11303 n=1 Tax=Erigeron canadensis TaxID=72917 RepID=UPI001CB9A24C|nr:G-type lectin S-receptor-like serine/threonine-protein kinase At1g11303 [Erigeron canadensis]
MNNRCAYKPVNVSNGAQFNQTAVNLFERLHGEADKGDEYRKYASGNTTTGLSSVGDIYGSKEGGTFYNKRCMVKSKKSPMVFVAPILAASGLATLDTEDACCFQLSAIQDATDNFSESKKLGERGFGPVYSGELLDGKKIAVKRLSLNSGQGLQEFKTEVKLIIKLQHKNLVKLLPKIGGVWFMEFFGIPNNWNLNSIPFHCLVEE